MRRAGLNIAVLAALLSQTALVAAQDASSVGTSPSVSTAAGATPPSAATEVPSTGTVQTPAAISSEPAAADAPRAAGTPSVGTSTEPAISQAANDPAALTRAATPAPWEGPVPTAYLGTAKPLFGVEIDAWLAQPRLSPDGTEPAPGVTVAFTRSLMGSDSRTVVPLVNLVNTVNATDPEVEAVAFGFAQVAREAETVAPEYAAYIQWSVAQSGSDRFIQAFAKATDSSQDATAALGPAGGAARGASPGSGTLTGTGAAGTSGSPDTISTVATSSGGGFRGGGNVSFSDTSGRVLICDLDSSTIGCIQAN